MDKKSSETGQTTSLAAQIARAIMDLGDEPGSPCRRIQFMGGRWEKNSERPQGGIIESALVEHIQRVLDTCTYKQMLGLPAITYREMHESMAGFALHRSFWIHRNINPDDTVKCSCGNSRQHQTNCDILIAQKLLIEKLMKKRQQLDPEAAAEVIGVITQVGGIARAIMLKDGTSYVWNPDSPEQVKTAMLEKGWWTLILKRP